MESETNAVGRFFDSLSDDYTGTIERCFPRYREMLWAVLAYLPEGNVQSVLELGCGTGNLTVLLHEAFPKAKIEVVDLSGESLAECRSRLPHDALTCRKAHFAELEYAAGSLDLVVSSIAIHHLEARGKQRLFENVSRWLNDDGVLCFADQFAGETADISSRHAENWQRISMDAGSTEEEWKMWMQHQRDCDHHDTLSDQMRWLTQAGFRTVDCVWRYLLWSVVQARK